MLAFFNPEERKRQEQIECLMRENAALTLSLESAIAAKEDTQDKLVEIFKQLHVNEQKYLGQAQVNQHAIDEVQRLGKDNAALRKERLEQSEELEGLRLLCAELQEAVSEYQVKLTNSETEKLSLAKAVEQHDLADSLLRKQLSEALSVNEGLEKAFTQTESIPGPGTRSLSNSLERIGADSTSEGEEDLMEGASAPLVEAQRAIKQSKLDFELESNRLQREYELGMLRQLRETFLNLQTLTGLTNSALRDSMKQIDHVLTKR